MTHSIASTAGLGTRVKEVALVFGLLTVMTGLLYPALTTGVAQTLMPERAGGSLVYANDRNVGSALIGQNWSKTPYFQTRPSAVDWNGASSGATNFGPGHPQLIASVKERLAAWQSLRADRTPVPVDLLTASASGLDPHISRDAALYQVPIVARRTGLSEASLLALVDSLDEAGLFGRHHYVNVLKLNLGVESLLTETTSAPSHAL